MEKERDNSFGVAAVVLAILAVVFSPTIIFGALLGILALIFGIIQRKRMKNRWSTWAIALGILAIIISGLALFGIISLIQNIQQTIETCSTNPSLPGCADLAKLYGAS